MAEFEDPTSYTIRLLLVEHDDTGWHPGRLIQTTEATFTGNYSSSPTLSATISRVLEPDLGKYEVVDVEVFVGTEWLRPLNNRFVLVRHQGDGASTELMWTYSGIGYNEFVLQRGRIMPTFGPMDQNGQRTWQNQKAGQLLAVLLDEGHARSWGARLERGFDLTVDSAGNAFDHTFKERKYEHGTPYLQVIEGLVADGIIEYASDYSSYVGHNQLNVYNVGTGADLADPSAATKVNLGEAPLEGNPQQGSIEEVFTRMTAQGEGLLRRTKEDFVGSGFEKFGQLEGWLEAGGVDSVSEADKLALAALVDSATAREQDSYTYIVNDAPEHLWPYRVFNLGDWVQVPGPSGPAKARVTQIVLVLKEDGRIQATVNVGALFSVAIAAVTRRQRVGNRGSRPGGSQTPPMAMDLRTPAAPTGLSLTSEGYWDADGAARSKISLEWGAVTEATQGDDISIDQYEVYYRLNPTDAWKQLTVSSSESIDWFPFEPGTTVYVRVRARSTGGQWSAFSESASVTVVNPTGNLLAPDDPIVASDNGGIVYAEWNGLLATSAPPPQFAYVLTQVSDDELGPFAIAGQQLLAAGTSTIGGLAPGDHWVRLVPYDRLGQAGAPSNAIPVTVVDVMSRKPAAPESVAAVSEGYWEGVTPQSRITVSWDEVTEGEDGEPITIRLYEVWGERDGVPAHPLITTAADVFEVVIEALAPLAEWTITVRAQSEFLALSDFSDAVVVETEAPPMTLDAPTTPTVTSELGLIHVYWDGNVGDPPAEAPAFLRAVVVEISDDWDGSDGTWIPVGSLLSAGQRGTVTGIAPGLQRWVRLSALDMFGRFSDPSEVVAVTVQGTGETIIADAAQVGVLAAAVITAGTDDILQLIAGQVEIITSQLDPLQAQVNAQGETVAAVEQRFTFDATGLTIASPDSQFKLRLDNDSLDFIVGDTVRAYLTAEAWNAQRVVTSSLRVGLWEFVQENPPSDPDAPGTGSLLMKYTG